MPGYINQFALLAFLVIIVYVLIECTRVSCLSGGLMSLCLSGGLGLCLSGGLSKQIVRIVSPFYLLFGLSSVFFEKNFG